VAALHGQPLEQRDDEQAVFDVALPARRHAR
jgi:hypothetical protein